MEDLVTNWEVWAGVIAAAVILFERIAKITPTETDNKVLKTIYKITSILGINVKDNKGK